ncbi:hypothetical protein P8452_42900 [Trifolium repens]|nr:hypothetical protein P8452_42900 [Trifolium repens]
MPSNFLSSSYATLFSSPLKLLEQVRSNNNNIDRQKWISNSAGRVYRVQKFLIFHQNNYQKSTGLLSLVSKSSRLLSLIKETTNAKQRKKLICRRGSSRRRHRSSSTQDHGIFRDGSKEIPEAQHPLYRRILLQDLNRQGAVVLEGKTLDMKTEHTRAEAKILARRQHESDGVKEEERRNRISKMIQIEDLQAQDGHPVAPLCIKDPRDYFDSQQANAVKTLDDSLAGTEQTRCSLGYEEAYGSLRASISKIETKGLNDPLLSPEVALKMYHSFSVTLGSFPSHLEFTLAMSSLVWKNNLQNTSWTVALVYGFFKQAGCHSLPVFLSTPSHKSHINWIFQTGKAKKAQYSSTSNELSASKL